MGNPERLRRRGIARVRDRAWNRAVERIPITPFLFVFNRVYVMERYRVEDLARNRVWDLALEIINGR